MQTEGVERGEQLHGCGFTARAHTNTHTHTAFVPAPLAERWLPHLGVVGWLPDCDSRLNREEASPRPARRGGGVEAAAASWDQLRATALRARRGKGRLGAAGHHSSACAAGKGV